MSQVTARMKVKGKHYEILVDLDEALKLKAGKGNIVSALKSRAVYYDMNKGTAASNADLTDATFYGTNLAGANLTGAINFVPSYNTNLKGTTMPDGTIHP